MSDRAVEELSLIAVGHGLHDFAAPEQFAPIVAKSISAFLTSDYFTRSGWFQRQRVHTVAVCTIANAQESHSPIFHLLKLSPRGYQVVSPDECALPETYYEERLIEEVRIECGVAESADHPKGRLP